jgi:hypothetical protein
VVVKYLAKILAAHSVSIPTLVVPKTHLVQLSVQPTINSLLLLPQVLDFLERRMIACLHVFISFYEVIIMVVFRYNRLIEAPPDPEGPPCILVKSQSSLQLSHTVTDHYVFVTAITIIIYNETLQCM